MLIDWFTVSAQVFNFLALVWLLKRYLYHPVLAAIDARDKKIAEQLQDAETKKAEAQKERDDYQHKNEEFEQQRQTLLSKATEEVKTERERLLEAARKDSEELRAKLRNTVAGERDSLNRELATQVQQEVFAISRKALADLADTSLDERMADVFIRRLQDLNEEQRGQLRSPDETALLRSASPLPPAKCEAIASVIQEVLGHVELQFETRPELVSGIELTSNGHKLAWSIADYLASLAKSVDGLLELKAEETAHA